MRTITFEVTAERDQSVWRRIELTEEDTLHDLHRAIQDAFLLDDGHLYAFFTNNHAWDRVHQYGGPRATGAPHEASRTTLAGLPLKINKRFLYLFDFGAELRHEVKVIGEGLVEHNVEYPRMVDSLGTPPRQCPAWEEEKDGDGEAGHHRCDDPPHEPNQQLVTLVPAIRTCLDAHDRRRFPEVAGNEAAQQQRNTDDLAQERDLALALLKHSGANATVIHTDVEHAIESSVWGWLSDLPRELSIAGLSEDGADLALKLCDAWRHDDIAFDLPLVPSFLPSSLLLPDAECELERTQPVQPWQIVRVCVR